MQILSKYIGNKLKKIGMKHTTLKLHFEEDERFIKNVDNELKISESKILLGFEDEDLKDIKVIYDYILRKHNYDKTNSFLLALCIIIASKITDARYSIIFKGWL